MTYNRPSIKAGFANKFKAEVQKRKLSQSDVDAAIHRYLVAKFPNDSVSQANAAVNLKKDLARDQMSEKLVRKAFGIIGLTDAEIEQVIDAD